MLQRITDLPDGIEGVRASGRVTRNDYREVFEPMVEQARRQGRRMRLLYELASDVEGFSPGAAWEDARLGLQHLRLFERCAVVTDLSWAHKAARFIGAMLPCAFEVFAESDRERALQWLQRPAESAVGHRLLRDSGVLVLEPERPLRAEDFEALALTVDPWIETKGELNGIVIHATAFPGWDSFGSALRHLQFVRDHQRKVRRLALVSDARLAKLAPSVAEHLAHPEVRHFAHDELDAAVEWASGGAATKATSGEAEPAERARG